MPKLPPINNEKLRLNALTHRSYINKYPRAGEDNERLEFLGHAVLGLAVLKLLFEKSPYWREGDLTNKRAKLVNKQGKRI